MPRRLRVASLFAVAVSHLILNACSGSSAAPDAASVGGAGSAGSGAGMGGATGGGGAGGMSGAAAVTDSGSPFHPSTLKVVDKSDAPSTGLVVVALNPQINATIQSVEIFGVVRNDSDKLHCFPKVGLSLLSGGTVVFTGTAQVDAPSAYVLQAKDTQPMPCMAPKTVAPFHAIGDASGSAVDTADVTFSTADFPGAFAASSYPTLSGTVMGTMPNGEYGFSGEAQISTAIHNVALVGYPRDASGLPLGRLQAFNLSTLPPGPWKFTTSSGVKSPFHDVLVAISYLSGP